jgi:hypothetical protein
MAEWSNTLVGHMIEILEIIGSIPGYADFSQRTESK